MSKITFKTTKEFLRFQVRLPMTFLSSLKSCLRNWKKEMQHLRNQLNKTCYISKTFLKDTVDLRMFKGFVWLTLLAGVTKKVLCKGKRRWTNPELNCPEPATRNSQDIKEQTIGGLYLSLFKTNPNLLMLRARLFITMRILIFHQPIV